MFQTFIQRMMIYSSFKYQNFHPRIAETNQWPLSATMMWRKKHLFLQMWYIQPFWACSVFGMQLTSGPYQFPLAWNQSRASSMQSTRWYVHRSLQCEDVKEIYPPTKTRQKALWVRIRYKLQSIFSLCNSLYSWLILPALLVVTFPWPVHFRSQHPPNTPFIWTKYTEISFDTPSSKLMQHVPHRPCQYRGSAHSVNLCPRDHRHQSNLQVLRNTISI